MAATSRVRHVPTLELGTKGRSRNGVGTGIAPPMRLFQDIRRISAKVPRRAWRAVPQDGSYNHDHYLYGSPRK